MHIIYFPECITYINKVLSLHLDYDEDSSMLWWSKKQFNGDLGAVISISVFIKKKFLVIFMNPLT